MKQRQMALFRGINVGTAKRVAMSDLRTSLEKLGFTQVRTLLNSGNVVYTTDGETPGKARQMIEKALEADQGVSSRVTVRTADELDAIVAADPLGARAVNHSRYHVAFLADEVHVDRLDPILQMDWEPEALATGERVAYFWCPDGLINSPLMKAAGRTLGTDVTQRTWATVLKIQAALKAGS